MQQTDRENLVDKLCDALNVRFEDAQHGLIQATSIANFKIWPVEEANLEGSHIPKLLDILPVANRILVIGFINFVSFP